MKSLLYNLKSFFEMLDGLRDKVLFVFIKPFWPRKITPNHLSIVRVIIGVFLFVYLFYDHEVSKTLVIWLFCIGAFTDMLDGSIARGLHEETKVGALLDSIADRVLIVPIAIYSLFSLHRWLFLLIILLEVINAIVSSYSHGKDIFIKANIFGKIKMLLQSVVFAGILFFLPNPPSMFFINILWLSVGFIIISIFFKFLEIRNAK